MKIYIASAFTEKERVAQLFERAKGLGFEIAGDWTIHRLVKPYEENKEISKQYAEEDISSVRNSDVFILLSNQEGSTGAHVEFGAALALAKEKGKPKIYVVGDHTSRSLFYYHHLVNIRKDIEDIFQELGNNNSFKSLEKKENMIKIGIIGGSGLDDPKLLENYECIDIITPYGHPSSSITQGKLNSVDVAILARHGKKHQIMPSNINYRANIWALKELGCTHIIATTAVGSLQEDIAPGHLVFPDQFIDRTTKRAQSFYDTNKVCHIPMAEPFCAKLRVNIIEGAEQQKLTHHKKGTVLTIEGPRFSTKAESHMFRSWNAHIINMSTVPEVVLAREAGLCYASIAMSTDYDCFMETREPVTLEEVLRVMHENAEKVKSLLKEIIPKIHHTECSCKEMIKASVIG